MNEEVRKSRIYSYFYGAGTVFQQFLILVGALFILIAPMAQEAKYAKAEQLYNEYDVLKTEADELEAKYEELYDELYDERYPSYYSYYGYYSSYYDDDDEEEYDYDLVKYEKIEVDKKDSTPEIEACNKALEKYNEANAIAEEAYAEYEAVANAQSPAEILFPIFGGIIVLVAFIWIIAKKFSFNKKPGEEAYDEEMQIKIEEAKLKALDKLNIIAEQIDKVEPVVLNGIANYDATTNKNPIGRIAAVFQLLVKFISSIKTLIFGAIVVAAYTALGIALSQGGAFIVPVVGAFLLTLLIGIKLYKKYEKDSYVSPKEIKKLEKMYPNLIFKFGSDENIRVSLPAITVYMFSDEQIYMYYQYLDIVTGKVFIEGIHEYFYEDIVGIVSKQETKKIFKRGGFLKLSIKAIDYLKENITVVSSGCQHSESYIVPMGCSLLDTSFVGMRNLIRQKKADKE